MVLEFSAASKDFDFKSFDCGEKSLNDYLRFYALKNDKNSISRIFIAYGVCRVWGLPDDF